MAGEKFSWWVNIQKALEKTLVPVLVFGLTLLLQNPQIINQLLGQWKDVTISAICLMAVNSLLNYLKNKDLGNG